MHLGYCLVICVKTANLGYGKMGGEEFKLRRLPDIVGAVERNSEHHLVSEKVVLGFWGRIVKAESERRGR